jgi:hypothetical protein
VPIGFTARDEGQVRYRIFTDAQFETGTKFKIYFTKLHPTLAMMVHAFVWSISAYTSVIAVEV